MLLQGAYMAEKTDSVLDSYRILMYVKETDKSYILHLIDLKTRYGAAHMELLFSKSKRVVIRKGRGGHAIRIWPDGTFTFYPYQAGIPFYFKPVENPLESQHPEAKEAMKGGNSDEM